MFKVFSPRSRGSASVLGRLLASAVTSIAAFSGEVNAADLTMGNSDAGHYRVGVVSYSELPFRTVIRQQYDYSCGSAALATLMRFQYGRAMTEADAFKAMYSVGDHTQIQKLGFSLLDMKKYLASIGYVADGFRLSLAELSKTSLPAIALIQVGSYKHFVVIKGIIGDNVLVGDPALGLRKFSAADFQQMWNGIAFIIHDLPASNSPPVFNGANDWSRWASFHPLSSASVVQPLTPLLRDLRVTYQIRPTQNLSAPLN